MKIKAAIAISRDSSDTIRLRSKPGVTRYYVGPVEVEVSNYPRRA